MNIYQEAADNANEAQSGAVPERRLWAAVLLQALEDWTSNNMRQRLQAEKFFFECPEDFSRVCRGAGLAPNSVLSRLRRMKQTAAPRPVLHFHEAA